MQEAQRYFDRFERYGHNGTELKETTSVGFGIIFEKTSDALYIAHQRPCGRGCIDIFDWPLSTLSASAHSKISAATLGDSSKLRVGEQVVTIGNTLGYEQSVTTGIVSVLNRSVQTGTDSTSKAVNATVYLLSPLEMITKSQRPKYLKKDFLFVFTDRKSF